VVTGTFPDSTKSLNGCLADAANPQQWSDTAFFPNYITLQTAYEAYKNVLSDVGMTMPVIDAHDQRVIKETRDSTVWGNGSVSGYPGLPDRETDVGIGGFPTYTTTSRAAGFDTDADGLPDWWETFIGTSTTSGSGVFSDANSDADGDGYTNLEEYLDYMATPHSDVAINGSTTFNLASLFRGYNKKTPTYKVGTATGITTAITDSTLKITATSSAGVVYLPVTVTDSEKSTMTREVAVFVTGSLPVGRVHVMPARPTFNWQISPEAVVFQTTATGTLTLLDLNGRVVSQVYGTGNLRVDISNRPLGVLVARFDGANLMEQKVISLMQ